MKQVVLARDSKIGDVENQNLVEDHCSRVWSLHRDQVYSDEDFPMFDEELQHNHKLLLV